MIIPIYQPQGSSSHLLAQQIGQKHGAKATHTGTLDPMAEGVLIVLTGEDRFNKAKYTEWQKEYQFEILFGFSTDTHDLLGLITDQKCLTLHDTPYTIHDPQLIIDLKNTLNDFIGPQTQLMPTFSAKRVEGKSGFDLGKQGAQLTQKQQVEIFDLHFNQLKQINNQELLATITKKISKVDGDFRQTKILDQWRNKVTASDQTYLIAQLTTTTSKRTYIRGLVRDIAEKLNIPATTFSIIRAKNGPYSIEDYK